MRSLTTWSAGGYIGLPQNSSSFPTGTRDEQGIAATNVAAMPLT